MGFFGPTGRHWDSEHFSTDCRSTDMPLHLRCFQLFAAIVEWARSSSSPDCTICHNAVEHCTWSLIFLLRGLMCKKRKFSFSVHKYVPFKRQQKWIPSDYCTRVQLYFHCKITARRNMCCTSSIFNFGGSICVTWVFCNCELEVTTAVCIFDSFFLH